MATVAPVTRYLAIIVQQDPFDIGIDDAGREQWSFNVLAIKTPSDRFVRELVSILEDAQVGRLGLTIFAGSRASLPPLTEAAEFITVRATSGLLPVGTHNDGPTALGQPGARVIAHAITGDAAEALAHAAYSALGGVRNLTVSA